MLKKLKKPTISKNHKKRSKDRSEFIKDGNYITEFNKDRKENGKENRINTIDILRGFSIMLMIIAHVGNYWLIPSDRWAVALFFLVVNVQGTNGFTYVAGMAFGYAWKRNQNFWKINQKEKHQNTKNRTRPLKHTIILLGLSVIFNIFAAFFRKDSLWFEYIWYWNILQTISVSRLLGELIMRWSKYIRGAFAVALIFSGSFLIRWIAPNMNPPDLVSPISAENLSIRQLIYLIFYNPLYSNGIITFFPYFIVGTIFGEFIYTYQKITSFHITAENQPYKRKLYFSCSYGIGVILFSFGILFGLQTVPNDYGWHLLDQINLHPAIEWKGLPLFLIANTWQWQLYSIGFEILFTTSLLSQIDFLNFKRMNTSKRKRKISIWHLWRNYGRYSLSIYFWHYIFLFMPWFQTKFPATWIGIPLLFFLVIISGFVKLFSTKKGRKMSIEYWISRIH
ncbi:MAG: DUF1624 domain-containing protein [Candidatus Lokiarchaeota archaeon]|nr:DUF1624 domain-containing protein [Candidatus Harpocratesius repetitus]